jgi:hypothetical protein
MMYDREVLPEAALMQSQEVAQTSFRAQPITSETMKGWLARLILIQVSKQSILIIKIIRLAFV